jgi:hypothetical protein
MGPRTFANAKKMDVSPAGFTLFEDFLIAAQNLVGTSHWPNLRVHEKVDHVK